MSQEEPAGSNQTLPPSPPSEDSAAKRRKLDPLDPQNLQVTMFPGYSRVPHTEHMFSFSDVSNAYYVSAAAAQICANIRRSAVSPVVAEDDSTFRDTIFVEPPEGPTLGVDFSGEWKLDVARSDLMDTFLDALDVSDIARQAAPKLINNLTIVQSLTRYKITRHSRYGRNEKKFVLSTPMVVTNAKGEVYSVRAWVGGWEGGGRRSYVRAHARASDPDPVLCLVPSARALSQLSLLCMCVRMCVCVCSSSFLPRTAVASLSH